MSDQCSTFFFLCVLGGSTQTLVFIRQTFYWPSHLPIPLPIYCKWSLGGLCHVNALCIVVMLFQKKIMRKHLYMSSTDVIVCSIFLILEWRNFRNLEAMGYEDWLILGTCSPLWWEKSHQDYIWLKEVVVSHNFCSQAGTLAALARSLPTTLQQHSAFFRWSSETQSARS